MKKSHLKIVLCTIICAAFMSAAAGYIFLASYYNERYSFGTYINGIYCTGKTPEEVNEILKESYVSSGNLLVQFSETETEILDLSTVACEADYAQQLQQIFAGQNPWLWIKNLFGVCSYELEPEVVYDDDSLLGHIGHMRCMADEENAESHGVAIRWTDQGYELEDHTRHIFDRSRAADIILDAVRQGKSSVNLVEKDCYYDLEITPQIKAAYDLWAQIENFQSFSMKYLFGSCEEIVDASVTSQWITLDSERNFVTGEDGGLVLDESAVADYIARLAQKYDTYGLERTYLTHDGKTVTVEQSIYGNQLDQEAECEYLTQAFYAHNTADREPQYQKKALYQGDNDIGPTYIEVNLTQQKLCYVKEGALFLETDIVSGSIRRGTVTPSMMCYIQGMYRNTILRGGDSPAFVYYWVPIYKGIGIHDATWRKQFGGEIYLTNGSHGCINVPLDQMEVLYADIEKGMPVILFYEDSETL